MSFLPPASPEPKASHTLDKYFTTELEPQHRGKKMINVFFFSFQILRRADKNGKTKILQFLFINSLCFRLFYKEEQRCGMFLKLTYKI